jgi:NAD(P)-dependent dehydrogenase (short-subunit alcohol dehydrogenase family)
MTEKMYDLSERVALVTGAGQNVGAGIARALSRQGAHVLVNDIVQERADEVVHQIKLSGGTARTVLFDVSNLGSVLTALATTEPIDILVNNAGNAGSERMQPRPFVEMDPEAWESPIRVNLYGVLHCCHAVVPGMCARGRGRVVTISSGAATAGVNIGVAPYSAGKGGAIAFTRSLALEVARAGVTANSLAIGLMKNPDPQMTARLARSIPVGRTGTPEDVAAACVWLASDEAAWVTAQTIQVNGGSITT